MTLPTEGERQNYSRCCRLDGGVVSVVWREVLVVQHRNQVEISVGGVLTSGMVGPGLFYTHERERSSQEPCGEGRQGQGSDTGPSQAGGSKPREGRLSELATVSCRRRGRGRDYWANALLEHFRGRRRVGSAECEAREGRCVAVTRPRRRTTAASSALGRRGLSLSLGLCPQGQRTGH
jgi:hypothetical protein